MTTNKALLDELKHIYLLESLDEQQLDNVVQSMQPVTLQPRQSLFETGSAARYFYYLREGQVKLFSLSADGDEKVFDIIQPGQTFAEAITFMDRNTYPVSAEAIVESKLYAFNMTTYRSMLESSTEACFHLMATMSRRLRDRVIDINNLSLQNATYRLVSFLLNQIPDNSVTNSEIHLSTPKHIIASRLSIKPETFSRILSRLAQNELISVHGNDIHLNDVEGLRELLHG